MDIEERYLKTVIEKFKEVKQLGDSTIEQLTDSELHWSINEESNSIAVIMKHMSGNMISRWSDFLTSDGEKKRGTGTENLLMMPNPEKRF